MAMEVSPVTITQVHSWGCLASGTQSKSSIAGLAPEHYLEALSLQNTFMVANTGSKNSLSSATISTMCDSADDWTFDTDEANDEVERQIAGTDCPRKQIFSADESTSDGSVDTGNMHDTEFRTPDGFEVLQGQFIQETGPTEELCNGGSGSLSGTDDLAGDDDVQMLVPGTGDSPHGHCQSPRVTKQNSCFKWSSPITSQEADHGSCSASPEVPRVPLVRPHEPKAAGCIEECIPWLFPGLRLHRSRTCKPSTETPPSVGSSVEYDLSKLEFVGQLGHGTFGSVSLVRCKATGQHLALKAVSKRIIAERCLQRSLSSEKEVMQRCQSPFAVQLAATFSCARYAYFLEEAAMGGDLYKVYSRRFLFGSEKHARFYTACMLRALEHLHGKFIIYRDLRMENVVLGMDGYGKLCDFGLSKALDPAEDLRAHTVCGTFEYMAPEVVLSKHGYTVAVDWWSLGVLVYELMVADTPFAGGDSSSVLHSARRGIEAADLPEGEAWAEVVGGLLQLEPGERLPERKDGIRRFEEQAWFSSCGFDWPTVSGRSARAPYVPASVGHKDSPSCCAPQRSPLGAASDLNHNMWAEWDAAFEDRLGPMISTA